MMMFETSKHVPKTKKRCCVFKNIYKNLKALKFVSNSMKQINYHPTVSSVVLYLWFPPLLLQIFANTPSWVVQPAIFQKKLSPSSTLPTENRGSSSFLVSGLLPAQFSVYWDWMIFQNGGWNSLRGETGIFAEEGVERQTLKATGQQN